jgi:hypothetical protein
MSQDNGDVPGNVVAFLGDHIASLAQLEVLLLLRERAESLTAADVGRALRIDAGWAGAELHALAVRGLLVEDPGPPATFRLASDPALAETLDAVAETYAQRRVTVVSLILAKPTDTVRVFADAFRLRKE